MRHPYAAALLFLTSLAAAAPAPAQTFDTLRSYWYPVGPDSLCAASSTFPYFPPSGYFPTRTEGLVFPPSVNPPPALLDMRRLDRWFSPSRYDNRTTTDPAWQGAAGDTRAPDYFWVGSEGWIFTDAVAGTSEMRGYVNGQTGDSFITADTRYTTTNSVPGYVGAGWQGQIINDPLGRSELLGNFNFGQMHNGGPAAGIGRLQLLLFSYSDVPIRHAPLFFENLFFGFSFPSVNGAFWNNSMGSWIWSNPGIRTVVPINDPETTANEDRWSDVWNPAFEPFLYLTLRAPDGEHFVSCAGGPSTYVSATGGGSGDADVFSLADINAGNLLDGDECAFKTLNGTWLRASALNAFGDGVTSSVERRFTVTKVSGSPGAQVRSGDVIRLRSVATGKFLNAAGGGNGWVHAEADAPSSETDFTILKSAVSSTLQARQALAAAVAGGLNLADFDDDGDGTVTDTEMQLFLLGAAPPYAAGAGTRAMGPYSPPGSTVSTNLAHVVGAGEDVGLATIVHELSHALGANYELYGAYSMNNEVAIMGPTIYPVPDSRRIYLHDPWTRMRFGWLQPRIFSMTDIGACATLEVSDEYPETDSKRPILLVDPLRFNFDTGEGEFFMLEYRNVDANPGGYDKNCPSKGLCIWQCRTGPGGANIILPATAGACCTGEACTINHGELCMAPSVYRGDGTVCGAGDVCTIGPIPVTKIDGSINLLAPYTAPDGSQVMIRGWFEPWTTANQPSGGIVPKYTDDSPAPVHIRIGRTSIDKRSIELEWSFSGDLPSRIDSLSRRFIRRGQTFDINGMFSVKRPRVNLYSTSGTFLHSLAYPASYQLNRIPNVLMPRDHALGTFHLKTVSDTFPSNRVQIQVLQSADWNYSGGLTTKDVFDYLNDWFSGTPDADFNNSGTLTIGDVFDFLADWFAGN